MKIVLFGSGNVATHLGMALKQAGDEILQVWSRNEKHANELANQLQAKPIINLLDVNPSADIYIIAVVDDAIAEVARELPVKDKLIVHTSGSTGIDVLTSASDKIGVIYPLQTFSKQKVVDFSIIPIAIEGNTLQVTETLAQLAGKISTKILKIDSLQRRALHVAAVFACNFTNHLYAIAQQILNQNNLDFDLIKPLIAETAAKIQIVEPEQAQTGPAIRKDINTLKKHRQFLENNPDLLDLYDKLSHRIIKSSESK